MDGLLDGGTLEKGEGKTIMGQQITLQSAPWTGQNAPYLLRKL